MPYIIIKADNGDAWVEVRGKKMAPPQISRRSAAQDEKTAEDYLGEPVTRPSSPCPPTSTTASARPPGRRPHCRAGRQAHHQRAHRCAALAFGLDKQDKGDRKIAVYDLGGGTFDISIIEIADVDGEKQFECWPPTATPSSAARTSTAASSTTSSPSSRRNRRRSARTCWPTAAPEGSRRKGQDRAVPRQATTSTCPYITAGRQTVPKHLNIKITRSKLEPWSTT